MFSSRLLSYLLVNKLACQFHGCWQRAQDTWIRDKEHYDLWLSWQRISNNSLLSPVPWGDDADQLDRDLSRQGIAVQERNPRLRRLESFLVGSKHGCLLFGGRTLNPSSNGPFQDVQECDRPLENYLPTETIKIWATLAQMTSKGRPRKESISARKEITRDKNKGDFIKIC